MADEITADQKHALVKLGYLAVADQGSKPKIKRAISRFQRHAARAYRMPHPDASGADVFSGLETGVCDPATAAEITKWIERGWVLPLGRFKLQSISVGGARPAYLREDAAAAWNEIVGLVTSKGGVLDGNYGDSARPVHPSGKIGTSRYSFHYAARAVDICQEYTLNKNRRYWVARDPAAGNMYWRIYCSTTSQAGDQGVKVSGNYYSFAESKERKLPDQYFIDLTAVVESTGKFERIKAQGGWETSYNKAEWWHFQYKLDKQKTFLDEMELIGYSEARLKTCGWSSDAMLDHPPG